jgi:predicted CXXCH cytochrome family protein
MRWIAIGFLASITLASHAATPPYTGSEACAGCHAAEYAAWKTSHHYQAMLPATGETVLGDFDDATFDYGGVKSRFFKRDGQFRVETDGPDGSLREFEIAYTFGFYPLQQYLVTFPNGRYQALNVVWDSRPAAAGGQRWVHLYPADEGGAVRHDDRVHWTGSFQNWNARCAVCHSTGLDKNYAAAADRYRTEWQEIDVACEACHGAGAAHLQWANAAAAGDAGADPAAGPNKGFAFSLADRGPFGPAADGPMDGPMDGMQQTLQRIDGAHPVTQLETCAACHSRRSELGPGLPTGSRYGDRYRLALIEPGLYFPDGQIRDEVYVYGSFMQSRMFAAGVVCTNCHEPHSNRLLAEGNALCTQCHAAAVFDAPQHHHHAAGSPGAACVECHMPERTYMVVDDRRDHSFRVPEPRLSLELGRQWGADSSPPDACTQCHADRDAKWAAKSLDGWGVAAATRATHAPTLAAAWAGRPAALPDLLRLAADTERPAIVRASAALATGAFPARETFETVVQLLYDDDALVREAAARSLDWVPLQQRYTVLQRLIDDERKAVRMAVARQLAGVPAEALPDAERQALAALQREYLQSLQYNADMPEEQMNLGLYYTATGDGAAAEQAYRRALKLAPAFTPALLNLADLYRANGLDAQARPLLEQAIAQEPQAAAPYHALGLLEVRGQQLDRALPQLQKAAELDPQNARYAYVLGVAQWESGQREQAIATLEAALAAHPDHSEITNALASYREQL